jgi:uncharacterized damage-inducible protein DinB
MKKYFLKLYQFNAWANERVIACLKQQDVKDEKTLSVFGHVLAAQFLWLHRIKGLTPPNVKLWGDYSLDTLEKMVVDANQQWLDFVESNDNFDRELTYTNYTGDPYTNNVESIMMHLVNHCSYHRAQVALLLRQQGFEPINTDLITYDRVVRGQWKE